VATLLPHPLKAQRLKPPDYLPGSKRGAAGLYGDGDLPGAYFFGDFLAALFAVFEAEFQHLFDISQAFFIGLALGVRFSDRKHYTLDLALAKPVGDMPTNSGARSLRFNAAWTYQFP
jgi:hypothetical protein